MPAGPYSTSLWRIQGVGGDIDIEAFVVPPGYRCVVKCVTLVWGHLLPDFLFDGWMSDAAGTKLLRYSTGVSNPEQASYNPGVVVWWGMWVFDDGEPIYVRNALGAGDWHGSGYLLRLAA